jgi:hypothetical protein
MCVVRRSEPDPSVERVRCHDPSLTGLGVVEQDVFNTNRIIAAGLVSLATLVVPVQSAQADPDAGTAVVITGNDYYVSADGVTVRHGPTRHSAVVELAHQGEPWTVHGAPVADPGPGSPPAEWLDRAAGAE